MSRGGLAMKTKSLERTKSLVDEVTLHTITAFDYTSRLALYALHLSDASPPVR